MTAENDGVPPDEANVEPERLDPATEQLPLNAATAKKLAGQDAAARRAQLDAPADPPPPVPNAATEGVLTGDLFDRDGD